MFGFTQPYLHLLSIFLPVAVTAAALPYNGMSLLPRFDKLRNISCNLVSPERMQDFFASAGIGSTGLFVAIVLGPVVVRSILRWQNNRRGREEQEHGISAAVIVKEEEKMKMRMKKMKGGGEQKHLMFGDNPDYHGDHDSKITPPPSASLAHAGRVRHLRIHSLDELPPPTMDDVSTPNSSWSCPASPVLESAPPAQKTGRRRSPFNPMTPGMKTTWEDGVDPVTGRRWRRKLVVYTSLETPVIVPSEPGFQGRSSASRS